MQEALTRSVQKEKIEEAKAAPPLAKIVEEEEVDQDMHARQSLQFDEDSEEAKAPGAKRQKVDKAEEEQEAVDEEELDEEELQKKNMGKKPRY